MVSLVGSLADNKAALGRRYADWAISAPTLESAVAAAAMAQDELGHARCHLPGAKALGAEIADEGHVHGHPLALLDDQLPDWTALIAANLLVDGVLTTFVAACAGSSIDAARPARAQDPPGGGLAPGPCRGLGPAAVPLRRRARGARRAAPRDVGARRPLARPRRRPRLSPRRSSAAWSSTSQAAQRERVRTWLAALLGAEGVADRARDPADWSGWDPATRRWTP